MPGLVFRSTIFCFTLLLLMISASSVHAQNVAISGVIRAELEDNTEPLQGANIQLFSLPDSTALSGTSSDDKGAYRLLNVSTGDYYLQVSYLGFGTQYKEISVEERDLENMDFTLSPQEVELGEFSVIARRPRVDVRGDTTAFHADGYRTNRDANVQELITRMPGFTVEDGEIQAQGEQIASVLVDGEEFFGEDAALALQNLPAEIVAQIEVYDRQSDQAEFTGFRDGNTRRTVNIVTKDGMNRGRFGRANSGYGSQTRYLAGGNYNHFDGSQRISLVGMSNNVNQQNFSSEDLLGVAEASGGRGGRGATRNFRVGGQSGISAVNSAGLNFINNWDDIWKVNASYFFNMSDNTHDMYRERQYLTGFSADQLYDEDSYSTSENYNHRFDMRLEYNMDDKRSLIISPRMSFQNQNNFSDVLGITFDQSQIRLNQVLRENSSENKSYHISGDVLYRQRFEKRGRTISAFLRTNINDRTGFRNQFDESHYYDGGESSLINNQQTDILTGGYTLSGNLTFTEPVTESTQLMLSYEPSLNRNESIQDVFRFDETTGAYTIIDTTLTNRYQNHQVANRVRGSYRFSRERVNANVSFSWQHTAMDGEQTFPQLADIRQTWSNILPDAYVQLQLAQRSNIRLSYNTNTRTPSVRQLQDVIDNSNPLRMSTGNPNLNQQFSHNVSLRLRHADPESGSSINAFVSASITDNFIGNRTFTAQRDTLLQDEIVLARGARLVTPENIGQSHNIRFNIYRSRPVDFLMSNLNLNAGVSLSRRPSYIDEEKNLTDNTRLSSGITVSSNISDRIDFRVSYDANYNIVSNSVRPELDNNYYSGRVRGSFNLMPWGGLVIASDFNMRHYEGLGDDFNQSSIYWNGSLGYKFLENEAAEVRVTLFDILGQNDNITRSISDDYIEDYRSNVLTRYFIMTFSYNFRAFGR